MWSGTPESQYFCLVRSLPIPVTTISYNTITTLHHIPDIHLLKNIDLGSSVYCTLYRAVELHLLYITQTRWAPFTVRYTLTQIWWAPFGWTPWHLARRREVRVSQEDRIIEVDIMETKIGKTETLNDIGLKKKKVLETWLSEFHNDKSSVSVVHTIPGIILLQLCSCIMVIDHMDHYGPF